MSSTSNEQDDDNAPVQTHWVSPLKPLTPGEFDLPPPDQVGVTVIFNLVICFTTTPEFDEARFVAAVQTATSCLVWENPALSGTVSYQDEERHRLKLVIPEDPKVRVNIKHLNENTAQELKERHWPPSAFLYSNVCLDPTLTFGIDSYNFGVQANIIPGGLVLLLQMNHTIMDGMSFAVTAAVFGQHLARAMDGKEPKASGLLPPGALDRSTAYGTHPARGMLEWKDWKPAVKMNLEEAGATLLERLQKITMTVWHISKEKQEKLRASMQTPGKPKPTMASCLAAFLWKHFTRARGLGPDVATRLLLPVSARGRVKEIHPTYVGNALVHSRAKATVAELNSLSAHALCERIGDSVEWWTPARIREFWGSIDACDDVTNYALNADRDFGTDCECTNLTNFPFYRTHWGRGLQVEAWRAIGVPFTDGWMGILPRMNDGSSEVFLYSCKDTAHRLMEDHEFRAYMDFWCSNDDDQEEYARQTAPSRAKL